MPRDALWKGFVSFGLVEIPVELVTAEVSHELSFHLFDRRDRTPVGNRRVSKTTGEDVPWSEIVKGYEYSSDEYVLLSDQELRGANAKATGSIEILDFVNAADVHPSFFDKPYYLRPTRKRGHKAYALLHRTLEATGQMGVARVVIRTREHLAGLTTRGPALMLCLLRFAHELREPGSIGLPEGADADVAVSKKELELAERLVEDMTGKWTPDKYKDTYRDDVLAMIERKVKAGKLEPIDAPVREPAAEAHGDVLDLMPLLKRSVERGAHSGARETRARPARAAARTTHAPRRSARPLAHAVKRRAPRRRSA
ncbi:MAG TPA: Ku protein [Planctomycetota bacterium]|nr:Ku protein [Planctomycetota bacterium]